MRIASLAPSNTEILFKIGAGGEVVATTSLCDHPDRARELPSIGGWSEGLDTGKVAGLDSDIAFASDDLQDDIVSQLEKQGVDVVQVKPHTLEEVFASIERIGRVVDRSQGARALVKEMRDKLEALTVKGARVYCEEWMQPPMVAGNWIPGLVETMGGEYFIEEGQRSGEFDLEQLERFDPEHIFLNVCGAGESIDTGEVARRQGWSDITAVRKGNVHVVHDALLNRPGPRLVDGAEKLSLLTQDF